MDESASKMMHSRIFSTKIRRRQKDELRGRKRRFPPRKTMSYDQELIVSLNADNPSNFSIRLPMRIHVV